MKIAAIMAALAAAFCAASVLTVARSDDRVAMAFAPSTECLACHNNLAAPTGEDVSIGASWRGSMMANAARDPYVLASIRRETINHASRAADIEDECATCHMPALRQTAHAMGGAARVLAPHRTAARRSPIAAVHASAGTLALGRDDAAMLDELARDGVTCTVCHQIATDRLGTPESFNGRFVVAPPRVDGHRRAFGPFQPDAGRRRIMHSVTGFEQEQAPHIRESALCATCHTLITTAFGPDGRVIGSLPEQMNYQEWRHSAFAGEQRGCQSCHMPPANGPVRVASVLGEPRDRLSRHTFLGGNAFMLRLMNRFRMEIGVAATSAELEATARATVRQLERDTATVAIDRLVVDKGGAVVDVVVRNLTGHKFPTGYPSRRAWLHVVATDAQGRTLFESGRVAEDGSLEGNGSDEAPDRSEPHYDEITSPDQVQIYESILGTPAGVPTTGLLQATQYLKDNRLLPRGFDKATAGAEIRVAGAAAADGDFIGGEDRIRYRIPRTTVSSVSVELRYQPIGFRWARNLAPYDAPEADAFVRYFDALASSSSTVVAIGSASVEASLVR